MLDGTLTAETTAQVRGLYDAARAYEKGRTLCIQPLYGALQDFKQYGNEVADKPRRMALNALESFAIREGIDLHRYPVAAFVSGFLRDWCDPDDGYEARTAGGHPW